METFKEEMKNSLKEMKEKINKNWKKLINPSKKHPPPKKKQEKKTNQTGEANSSRLEGWSRGNKEKTNQGNSGYGKSGWMNRNYRDKYNQQNTRDRKKDLGWKRIRIEKGDITTDTQNWENH